MKDINFMRIILFFDLPSESDEDKKNYRHFVKKLTKLGYIRMQYSIYTRIVNTQTKIERELKKVESSLPPFGDIRVLYVTEKQYQNMAIMSGNKTVEEKINEEKKHIII